VDLAPVVAPPVVETPQTPRFTVRVVPPLSDEEGNALIPLWKKGLFGSQSASS
jgi:hypothetical protein